MAKDPVSGNKIPLGSTAEEVRDDQPAMLSEGEFVIPADVVRYFGVQFFMGLRDKAKMGYEVMDEMGQLGNSEEAETPEDTLFNRGMPFTIADIDVMSADDLEGEEKGEEEEPIKAAVGAYMQPQGSTGAQPAAPTPLPLASQTEGAFYNNPNYGRDPVLPRPPGMGQFYGEGTPFGVEPTYYMDPDSIIHTIWDVEGFKKEGGKEGWLQISSPAEFRNYFELGGRGIEVAPSTPTQGTENVYQGDDGGGDDGYGGPGGMSGSVGTPGSMGAFGDVMSGIGDAVTGAVSGAVDAVSEAVTGQSVSEAQAEAAAVGATGAGMAVDATDDGDTDAGTKIICTAMVQQYGFGTYRQKLWLHHSLTMHPAYQKGYHAIFRPCIRYLYDKKRYNKKHVAFLRRWLENGTRRRTMDIWNETRGKRVLLHRLERNFWESVCFIVGKLK